MDSTFLQFFLILNVFLIGALAALGLQHAYAHLKTRRQPQKPHAAAQGGHLPPALKQQMLEAAQAHFQTALERSAAELERDLMAVSAQLNKQLVRLGGQIVDDETARYRSGVEVLRRQAEAAISSAEASISRHQAELDSRFTSRQAELEAQLAQRKTELESQLVEQLAAEKQRLIAQIDNKLADAVASFLTETLGHNVDLGAQSAYLTAMLEQHKADIIKGVAD